MEAFDQHGLPVIAPHTQRSWWTDRICAEFDPELTAEAHVLNNVVPFIRQRWQLAEGGIGLLGTSMGGQGALRLAYKRPSVFPVVAAISPAVAKQAADLIDVEYEILPHVMNVSESMAPEAPLLHDDLITQGVEPPPSVPSNTAKRTEFSLGDLNEGFEQADVIVEHDFNTCLLYTSPSPRDRG